jgi:alkanesulfonate monooxygenase SsuD/methylene tetrahydromethanopterin reductase-like flavin-dependent oxidoreductase (luciferase family)
MYDPFVALAAAASVTSTLLPGDRVALRAQRDPIALRDEVAPARRRRSSALTTGA